MAGRKIIITGGAGFIGCNTAAAFYKAGDQIVVLDDLSRRGTTSNLEWLKEKCVFDFYKVDIRDYAEVKRVFDEHADCNAVIHLAGQTAVTTSIKDPRSDFEINALGTFNILEAARAQTKSPIILYASTNKVYGGLEDIAVEEGQTRYQCIDYPDGIPETQRVDFHSPYGCSKGTADQYVKDYARIYGMPTIVFRQSCIYGCRQLGIEDQGWVAWFILAAICKEPIAVYGNGKQVRDVLFVDDLVKAYTGALENIETTSGKVYNIGGGPSQSISIWKEFQPLLSELVGYSVSADNKDWRAGDQPIFVADISAAKRDFDWSPTVSVEQGMGLLHGWIRDNLHVFRQAGIID